MKRMPMYMHILFDLITFCLGAGLLVFGMLDSSRDGKVIAGFGAALVALGALRYHWMRIAPSKDEPKVEEPSSNKYIITGRSSAPTPAKPLTGSVTTMVTVPIMIIAAVAAWGSLKQKTVTLRYHIEEVEDTTDRLKNRLNDMERSVSEIGEYAHYHGR
jgi:hypothetical protein